MSERITAANLDEVIKRNEVIEEQMKQSASLIWSKYNPMQINSPIQLALQILRPYGLIQLPIDNHYLSGAIFVRDKKKNTRLGERIDIIFSTRRVFHSAGMCLLEAEGFHPCRQVGFAGVSIEYLAVQEFGTGAAWREFFVGLAHTAAARCGKGDDGFTF